jgi:hypothetical protein
MKSIEKMHDPSSIGGLETKCVIGRIVSWWMKIFQIDIK